MTQIQKRLAAIMVADIAGYSRLMEKDESGTFRRLCRMRDEIIWPTVSKFNGRIIKTTGDGFLAEFSSGTASLGCGLEIQKQNIFAEADTPPEDRFHLRIGINVGDIIIDGDDVSGDGVNIAARLEPLAAKDGICVSGAVRDQLHDGLDVIYEDMGEQQLKNISRPIRGYRIQLGASAASKHEPISKLQSNTASRAMGDFSIVVMPFSNRTGDPNQEYVADGMTDSITIDLARIRDTFVVDASTAFSYKGKPVTTQQVGMELGIRFVLHGGVQRGGNKIRISAQLADTLTNKQLWADTFEGDASDLFALQDQVTARIGNSIDREIVILAASESRSRRAEPAVNDLLLQARALRLSAVSFDHRKEIERLLRQALSIEPDHAVALATLASNLTFQASSFKRHLSEDQRREKFEEGRVLALRAQQLDSELPDVFAALCSYALRHRDLEVARHAAERRVVLEPNNAMAYGNLAAVMIMCAEPQQAIDLMHRAMKLDPRPEKSRMAFNMGGACFMLGKYREAATHFDRSVQTNPRLVEAYAFLAMAYAMDGNSARSSHAKAEFLKHSPDSNLERWLDHETSDVMAWPIEYQRFLDEKLVPAWRSAGLPV